MARDLETIVELQEALDELAEAEQRFGGIPDWMKELHEEHSAASLVISELEAVVEEAVKERRQAETEISDAQEKLKRYQEQISKVSTQREYGALLKEIDTVKEQISELETLALTALERREEAEKDLAERREGFQDLDERYRTELAKWEEEKPAVAQRIDTLRGRIAVFRERLAPNILTLFDRTYSRHAGRALAPVRRVERTQMWHCGGCNYRVRPQAVVEIHSGGMIVSCESCKRLLYLEDSEL